MLTLATMESMPIEELQRNALAGSLSDERVARLRELFRSESGRCLIVGGAVRDFAIGERPSEIDVLVEGPIEPLIEMLKPGEVVRHDRFQTATCRFEWGQVDLAASRTESYPSPGSLPEVGPAPVEDDLKRRDFTVNALTIPLDANSIGGWPAVDGGWADLESRVLRVLHAASFRDDPTRIWRLARYAGRLGFEAAAETQRLAAEAIDDGGLLTTGLPRNGAELLRSLEPTEPRAVLLETSALGLLQAIGAIGLDFERLDSAESLLGGTERRLSWAALWWRASDATRIAEGLAVGSQLSRLAAQAANGDELAASLAAASAPSDVAAACFGWEREAVALAGGVGNRDGARLWLDELERFEPDISGSDLLRLGMPEGAFVGAGLRAAKAHALNQRDASRSELIEVAVAAAREAGWSS